MDGPRLSQSLLKSLSVECPSEIEVGRLWPADLISENLFFRTLKFLVEGQACGCWWAQAGRST